ncbi:MAG: DUF1016 N-terminal domain-containing protein [Thermoguttaceae bacterium]
MFRRQRPRPGSGNDQYSRRSLPHPVGIGSRHQFHSKRRLAEERAAYGEQIVSTLSRELTTEYSRGFTRSNLFYRVRFTEVFPDAEFHNT